MGEIPLHAFQKKTKCTAKARVHQWRLQSGSERVFKSPLGTLSPVFLRADFSFIICTLELQANIHI